MFCYGGRANNALKGTFVAIAGIMGEDQCDHLYRYRVDEKEIAEISAWCSDLTDLCVFTPVFPREGMFHIVFV